MCLSSTALVNVDLGLLVHVDHVDLVYVDLVHVDHVGLVDVMLCHDVDLVNVTS